MSSKKGQKTTQEGRKMERYIPTGVTASLVAIVGVVVGVIVGVLVGVVVGVVVVAVAVAAVLVVVPVSNASLLVFFIRFVGSVIVFGFFTTGFDVGPVFDSLLGGSRKRLRLGGTCLGAQTLGRCNRRPCRFQVLLGPVGFGCQRKKGKWRVGLPGKWAVSSLEGCDLLFFRKGSFPTQNKCIVSEIT